mmetsp:Transcript_5678/g.13814  ORF Transcript_5678/g.13814 Transcript_5678/m.13814 type:complete len:944 (+) Transcript_5678:17-2848(+)
MRTAQWLVLLGLLAAIAVDSAAGSGMYDEADPANQVLESSNAATETANVEEAQEVEEPTSVNLEEAESEEAEEADDDVDQDESDDDETPEDDSEEEETPEEDVDEESSDDTISEVDLDRSMLPRLRFRGKGRLQRHGRTLGRKLRFLHRVIKSDHWKAQRHVKNILAMCRAVKNNCGKIIKNGCPGKVKVVKTIGCGKKVIRTKPNSCKAKAKCFMRYENDYQRRLHIIYHKVYIKYLKIASRVYRGKFRALARYYLRRAKKSTRLFKAWRKLRARYGKLKKRHDSQKATNKKKGILLGKQKALIVKLRLVGSRLRKMLKSCKIKGKNGEVARRKLQNAFNGLLRKYKSALSRHKKLKGNLTKAITAFRGKAAAAAAAKRAAEAKARAAKAATARARAAAAAHARRKAALDTKLKNMCPFKDACGVCKGDERTCARRRSALQCHAVGDPHFRTFDGLSYNFMTDGEWVLARHDHPYRFEVQNRQWGQCQPGNNNRCNKGYAVMGDGHVVVSYAAWYTKRRNAGLVLINGRQRSLPYRRWVHLGGGALRIFYANTRVVQIYYCTDKRHCDTRVQINHGGPWRGASWQDIYVLGRWQWSSGRSMTGLCGNYDSNAANDRNFVFGNVNQFRVTGTGKSLFKNNRFRKVQAAAETEEDVVVSDDAGFKTAAGWDDEDEEEEMMKEEAEGIHDPEQQLEEPEEKSENPQEGEPAEPEIVPAKEQLKKVIKTDEAKKKAEAACKGLTDTELEDCEFDAIAGFPEDENRDQKLVEQLVDKEKKLKTCMGVTKEEALVVPPNRLPSPVPKEGYTIAFWIQVGNIVSEEARSIISRDNMIDISIKGTAMTFKAGSAQCVAQTAIVAGRWIQATMTVEANGSFQVYFNGDESCTANAEERQNNAEPLVIGKKNTAPCIARISQLYYAPIHITENTNKMRYALRRPPRDCTKGM